MQESVNRVAIRRQDKSHWECRTPLTPTAVQNILKKHPKLSITVQPSSKRVFSDTQYQKAGAIIDEDISTCSLIMGIKQIPADKLMADKTYLYFSHVDMGVPFRMIALDAILDRNIRLIDYEMIKDENDQRLIAFGQYAGIAGALDFLKGFGEYLMRMGIRTPFLHCNCAYKYFDLEDAYGSLRRVGLKIKEKGVPKELSPLIFGVTGRGRSGKGVMEVLGQLGVTVIRPDEIQSIWKDKDDLKHQQHIYVVNINTEDCMVPLNPSNSYNREEFYSHPENYSCNFNNKYLPYLTALFHNIYWKPQGPKYILKKDLSALKKEGRLRLLGICDVSVDIDGSIEMLEKFTSPDQPFFYYDVERGENTFDGKYQEGKIQYMAIDFLPSQLALDASEHFSKILIDWVDIIVRSDKNKELKEQGLPPFLERAVVACNNKLMPSFQYIPKLRAEMEEQAKLRQKK